MFLGDSDEKDIVLFVVTHPHVSIAALRGELDHPREVVTASGHHQGALQGVEVQFNG